MGVMEEAEETRRPIYYLFHYSVTKSDNLTTKVRVVFDGSTPTKLGLDLNGILWSNYLTGITVHYIKISYI